MADKLRKYQGFYGRLHNLRDKIRERAKWWKDDDPKKFGEIDLSLFKKDSYSRSEPNAKEENLDDYNHIYRTKGRSELIQISAAVMGIEFGYAAETAFVSPILLKIGVGHEHMTMIWGLSPLLGLVMTPILGSLSDGCKFSLGRRRPFILLLALGALTGLILIPNGEDLGHSLGDFYASRDYNSTIKYSSRNPLLFHSPNGTHNSNAEHSHPWGIFFTVLGTVLLDFDADSCQSPARAYLLDVTVPEDHARGLSTFTIMAGLGGFFGYALGGINWDSTIIGEYLGGHVRTVFTLITILFVGCITCTVTSFKEIPLNLLQKHRNTHLKKLAEARTKRGLKTSNIEILTYGSVKESQVEISKNQENHSEVYPEESHSKNLLLKSYLWSIVFMPKSLRKICITNLFCWMSHVCYSLYFTDFVGEAVFKGNPLAPLNSDEYKRYEEGVRFGCWGMSMYSLSCSCYSLIIEELIKRYRTKKVYIGGLLFYSLGMMLMAVTKNKIGVILFSWTAGIMYSTLFTVPYLLVAHYHSNGVFELSKDGEVKVETSQRGLGTDVGVVSSMVFLAQFILALGMGEVVKWFGTTTAIVSCASILAFFGAVSATRIMYLDL